MAPCMDMLNRRRIHGHIDRIHSLRPQVPAVLLGGSLGRFEHRGIVEQSAPSLPPKCLLTSGTVCPRSSKS
eukprot:8625475-Pyramimonas_sp.AAC.1